jgi:hypothetical protein
MGYIDHRRLIHSEAKKIGENHFALCSGHHVLIAPLSHANLSRSEHENLESDCPKEHGSHGYRCSAQAGAESRASDSAISIDDLAKQRDDLGHLAAVFFRKVYPTEKR